MDGNGIRATCCTARTSTTPVDTVCFFESGPAWVMGELDDEPESYGPGYAGDGGRDPGTDPGASGYVRFQNGVRAFINASKETTPNFELDLIGERGRIRLGAHVAEEWRLLDHGQVVARRIAGPATTCAAMAAAVEELIGRIEHGGPGSSSGEDGRRTLAILLGILQSAAGASGSPSRSRIAWMECVR